MYVKNKTNSSWWLGNDFFEEDRDILTGDIVSDRTSELIKLAGYRRAISNFVNIVTGKSDIPVYFQGSDSYTDGKSINISASIKDKDFDTSDVISWIKSKGIEETPYYKKLDADRNLTQEDIINQAMFRTE